MTDLVFAPRPAYAHRGRSAWPPRLFLIHATRGHTALALQDQATVSWFTGAAGDRGGWSPTADALVSADEDRCWIFEPALADLRSWHSAWSAGYGSLGGEFEWGADERAVSIEVAQSDLLEPYSDATIARLVGLVQRIEAELGFVVPRVRVPSWDQRRDHPVPEGFIGHEDTAHGVRTGKSDPGPLFPWARFLTQLQEVPVQVTPLDLGQSIEKVQRFVRTATDVVADREGAGMYEIVSGMPGAKAGYEYIVLEMRKDG